MPVGTFILRKYHSKQSDLPASQLLVADDLTIDLTRPNIVSTYVLSKSGGVVVTLGSPIAGKPSAGGMDGFKIKFVAGSADAHTVANAVTGFNGGGAGTVKATFGGALGDQISLEAYNGKWYNIAIANVTLGTA
jgi:hypothetical protein